MRFRMPIALLAILFGALETAGAAQELIFQGILRSLLYPLIAGTIGLVAGVLLLASGIALLIGAPIAATLVRATVYVAVPTFILIGIVGRFAGVAVTALGILFPLFLLYATCRLHPEGAQRHSDHTALP
jgi:hypothetical protein